MRSTRVKAAIAVAVIGAAGTTTAAVAGGGKKAKLIGAEEVPAVLTDGKGKLKLTINSDNTIDYTLSYEGLKGTAQQAHIHIGQRAVNGGIATFLCGGHDKPPCPASGSVSGTIDSGDMDPRAVPQGVVTLADLVKAIRRGITYANVHTSTFGGGEIRGQIGGNGDDDSDGNGDTDTDD